MFAIPLALVLGLTATRTEAISHVRPAADMVAALSMEWGRPVEVARPLRDVPVLLDEPGRSPAQRLNDLAFALHASLVRDGRTLRIERSPEDLKSLTAGHQKALRPVVEAGLSMRKDQLQRSATLGDLAEQVRAAQETVTRVLREAGEAKAAHRTYSLPPGLVSPGVLTPGSRLAFDLMRRMGTERLADLAPGEVRFFSDHPNAAESPLPPCADLVAAYRRLQDPYAVAAGASLAGGLPAKLVLRLDEDGGLLQIFDARGRRVDAGGMSYVNRVVYLGPNLPVLGSPGARWAPLDEPSRSLAAFLHYDSERAVAAYRRSLTGAPPAPFLHPEREDPLDFAVRAGVRALPPAPKTQGTVAVLADWTLDLADECVEEGRLDATAFERGLFRGGEGRPPFERVAHDGVTVVRPADPLAAEAATTDRAVLGASVRRILADGRIDMRNWPAAHFALYPSLDSPVTVRYLGGLLRYGLHRYDGLGDPTDCALVGAALAAGRPIVDAGLPPLRAILRDGIVKRRLDLKPTPGLSDLAVAPSTLLASGALDHARIALASTEAPVAGSYAEGEANESVPDLEASQMGRNTLFMPGQRRTEARTRQIVEAMYLKPHYHIGRRLTLTADLEIAPGLHRRIEMRDHLVDRTGLTFQQLPPAFRDGILAGIRQELDGEPLPAGLLPGDRVVTPP